MLFSKLENFKGDNNMFRFCMITLYCVTIFVFQAFTQTNIALNKTVTVSSVQSGNTAANAVDGNTGTRWCAVNGNVPQWLEVDLGAVYSITNSEVMWERNAVYKYQIETSVDQNNWTLKVDKNQNTNSQQTFYDQFSATARYIKITATGLPSGVWASIFEFRIFGSSNVPPYVTLQPVNQTVSEGQVATFSVTVGGSQPFTYQWKKGSTTIAGATLATYTTPATVSADNGAQYSCEISNWYGSITSESAILTVQAVSNVSKWIGTSDGKLYTDPTSTKVGIGTSAPEATLQVQSDNAVLQVRDNLATNENKVDISPTQISLRANIAAPVASTTIGQGNISLFQGAGLSVSGMGPASTVQAGFMQTSVPGTGSVTVDASDITLQAFGGSTPDKAIVNPSTISLGVANPSGPGPSTTLKKGEIRLFMGEGLMVSGMGPASTVQAGYMQTSVPGTGSVTVDASTVTLLGFGGQSPNQTIVNPGSISLGVANPGGPGPVTTLGKGEINLAMGEGLTVSGMGPSSNVRAGSIAASVPGSGSTTVDGGTVTVSGIVPGRNPTVIGGGFIKTDVVYVGTNGWSLSAPDYVFAANYKLMPLSKVEAFVKENGHLPEIPSAKEMEDGKTVNLVDMNMKLLKKIEELTLHSIEQEKRINQLEKILAGN